MAKGREMENRCSIIILRYVGFQLLFYSQMLVQWLDSNSSTASIATCLGIYIYTCQFDRVTLTLIALLGESLSVLIYEFLSIF